MNMERGTKQKHIPKVIKVKLDGVKVIPSRSEYDLASLAKEAEDKGDHFLVNGQKI